MDTALGIIILLVFVGGLVFFIWYIIKRDRRNKQKWKLAAEQRQNLLSYLKDKLKQIPSRELFHPEAAFYAGYKKNPTDGLHHMAIEIFNWLKIKADGCIIDFYDQKDFPANGGDTAGFYTRKQNSSGQIQEVILINKKHKNNALAVGAILAHEMMHLYLYRLNIVEPDRNNNELMTDLATIRCGLSLLVLNGFSFSDSYYLTIIIFIITVGRFIYYKKQELSFGYFKPYEFGKEVAYYLKEKFIRTEQVLGYISPQARKYLPHKRFIWTKSATDYIKILDRKHLISNVFKIIVPCVLIGFLFYIALEYDSSPTSTGGNVDAVPISSYKQNLGTQIDACKNQVATEDSQYQSEKATLNSMDSKMTSYQNEGDTDSYNSMVDNYNKLLKKAKLDYQTYSNNFDSCNKLVNQYNASN